MSAKRVAKKKDRPGTTRPQALHPGGLQSNPFALTIDKSLRDGPLGFFSPRSHWLIRPGQTSGSSRTPPGSRLRAHG